MKTQTITYDCLDGYKIEQVNKIMTPEQATALLSSKAQHRYSSVVRRGSDVEVSRHTWTCPYCNAQLPAYQEYFFGRKKKKTKGRTKANSLKGSGYVKIPRNKIVEMIEGQQQISLFSDDERKIMLNRPMGDVKLKCGRCGKVSSKYTESKQITFTKKKHLFEITVECDVKDVLAEWISKMWEEVDFPVYETATFNFKKGRTYLTLHSGDWEKVYTVSDITEKAEMWTNGAIHSAFVTYKAVQRNFKRAFLNYFPNGLPFDESELTPGKYVCLARFIGYPRNFYEGIPFKLCTTRLDSSFKKIGRALHSAANVEQLYNQCGLPRKSKTIRRIFFENPALIFYTDECVHMNQIINDVNLFRKLLSDENIFEILVQFHIFPNMFIFVEDYANLKGRKEFVTNLLKHRIFVFYDAVIYSALSPAGKKVKQEKWKSKVFGRPELDEFEAIAMEDPGIPILQRVNLYSIPMHPIDLSIKDCEIEAYTFRWLLNGSDYCRTGIELNNCLTGWSPGNHPVVAVYKKNVAVAAIEINISEDNRGIVQVRTKKNGNIADNPPLNRVYEKWRQKFNLEEIDDL